MNHEAIRKYIESQFKVDLSSRKRDHEHVCARAVYCQFLRNELNYTLAKIGKKIGRDHASVLNILKKYDQYVQIDSLVPETYHHLLVMIFDAKPKASYVLKDIDVSKSMRKTVNLLCDLNEKELIDFIPRIEIYKKSVMYNRKKKQEWERT